jgi:hypothetical protein
LLWKVNAFAIAAVVSRQLLFVVLILLLLLRSKILTGQFLTLAILVSIFFKTISDFFWRLQTCSIFSQLLLFHEEVNHVRQAWFPLNGTKMCSEL